ncbi:frequency clock protein [Nemania sp. NC0429]|nr:frequency clock protein [Nemania sp. NC0429]
MADPQNTQAGNGLPPAVTVTYVNPRRRTPENSITLRHHRMARDGSRRHPPPALPNAHASATKAQIKGPRRNSSEESNETGWSDARQWFEQSNQNAKDTLGSSAMDVDPPFFQKETDSSNEEPQNISPPQAAAHRHAQIRGPSIRPSLTKSSSADDYRSVIDDLTIENKRLREELRKLKQMGPDSMRNDKLFEVKVHGLPSMKRRELEATLRDFTTKLERSSTRASTSRKKTSGKSKEGHSSASKHASSTSGSNSRPVDSAYASLGTGDSSSSNLLAGQGRAARLQSNQNIQAYLRDIPEGLWPKPTVMTEHEKKKLVVKRLEHLFTGKMGHIDRPASRNTTQPIAEDIEMQDSAAKVEPPKEAAREAVIRTGEKRQKASRSRVAASTSITQTQSQYYSNSQSNADQSNSHDNDKDSGSGSGHGGGSGRRSANDGKALSPQDSMQPSEQRPTRPRDLDPDRRQVPADNMEYIRHLGIVAPESQLHFSARDVSPDEEGWVYLNLLGNLAQLHILNVTSDFIRSAVSEKSTKFQLSPDGRKIRWRGGDEGTRFTSDSGSKSQSDQSSDETDGSNEHGQRKKAKGSKLNLGFQDSNSSESFHYKPLFVRRPGSFGDDQQSGMDDSGSSGEGQSEDSNPGGRSKWDQSGVSTGRSQRKRRRDGAIIYYSGAPFCTDLSGDYGEVSPDTYDMTSSGDHRMQEDPVHLHLVHRPSVHRTASGSSIPFKPLSEPNPYSTMSMSLSGASDAGEKEKTESDTDDCIDADFSWSDSSDTDHQAELPNLEASGLAHVRPEDHFVIVVSTRRPIKPPFNGGGDDDDDDVDDAPLTPQVGRVRHFSHGTSASPGTADSIARTLANMSTESPVSRPYAIRKAWTMEIGYITTKFHRLPPVPVPPPAFYYPPSDSDSDEYGTGFDEDNSVSSERSILSKRPMLEGSADSDNRDLSGNDEEDENSDDGSNYDPSASISKKLSSLSGIRREDGPSMLPLTKNRTGSSAATAGGAGSGYYSSMEDA